MPKTRRESLIPLAVAGSLALILLQLAGAHLAPTRLWGTNALRFVPRPLEAALLLLALIVAVPAMARALAPRAAALWNVLCGGRGRRIPLRLLALGAVSFVLFVLFRSHNHFLGDGYFRLEELRQNRVSLRSADFLDLVVHREAWTLLRPLGFKDPSWAYALVSALAGAVWVMLLPSLSRRLIPDKDLRWTVPAFLLTLGSVQLFFGYLECYTLRELCILAYFLLALRALRGGSPLPATAMLVVASAFHLTCLALVPSLVMLFVEDRKDERGPDALRDEKTSSASGERTRAPVVELRRTALALLCLGAAVVVAGAVLIAFRRQYGGLTALLPLVPRPENAYGLFSAAHLGDLANFLLLVAPGPLLLLALGAIRRIRRHREGEAKSRDAALRGGTLGARFARRLGQVQRAHLFWSLSVLGPLGLVFILDPKLGCRDWDLLALPAVPLALSGLTLLFGEAGTAAGGRMVRAPDGSRTASLGAAAIILLGASLLHTVPWVVTNHSFERSSHMIVAMIENDSHHSTGPHPRWIHVGVEFTKRGLTQDGCYLLRKSNAVRPVNFWGHYNLGTSLMEQGRLEEAVAELERAATSDPRQPRGRLQLGVVYGMLGRYPDAIRELRVAVQLDPRNGDTYWNLGMAHLGCGQHREGAAALEQALPLIPGNVLVPYNIAVGYWHLGEWDKVMENAEAALRIDSRHAPSHLLLGQAYLQRGDAARALEHLRQTIAIAPESEAASRARQILAGAGAGAGPTDSAR